MSIHFTWFARRCSAKKPNSAKIRLKIRGLYIFAIHSQTQPCFMETTTEENIRIIFGLKLKKLRTDRRLSLQELSDKSGVSVSYMNEIENGKKYP
jgi:DNA-binding XRE family transcriptional regulator